MKRRHTYLDYLQDILDAAQKASRFVEGLELDDFASNDEKIFAVTRALEIMGEAAKRVPKSVQKQYPEIPWREMAGMRDKLTHDYFGVNIRRVWETVTTDLPTLQEAVARMVADLQNEEHYE